jgi:hypothetical protein
MGQFTTVYCATSFQLSGLKNKTQLHVYVLFFTDQEVKSVDMCKPKADDQVWTA